jgi:hypothetical protein
MPFYGTAVLLPMTPLYATSSTAVTCPITSYGSTGSAGPCGQCARYGLQMRYGPAPQLWHALPIGCRAQPWRDEHNVNSASAIAIAVEAQCADAAVQKRWLNCSKAGAFKVAVALDAWRTRRCQW